MDRFSLALFLLVGGAAFCVGFLLGLPFYSWVLRQRERRLIRTQHAIGEAARYLQRRGVYVSHWLIALDDELRSRELDRVDRDR